MRGRRVLVAVGVTDVGQFVIRELALAALVVSEEGAGESDALDDVAACVAAFVAACFAAAGGGEVCEDWGRVGYNSTGSRGINEE